MKTNPFNLITLCAALAIGTLSGLNAQEKCKACKIQAGPNGGRVLKKTETHLEYFVTADRKVQITALDKDHKAIPMGDQLVTVSAGDETNLIELTFEKQGDLLISNVALPEGDDFPVTVQVKVSADAETVTEKFTMDFSPCEDCDYLAYVCNIDQSVPIEDKEEKN